MQDLRKWLEQCEQCGQLQHLSGVDENLEMGVITEETTMRKGPALLFGGIPGLAPDFRVLTNILATPQRVGISLGLPRLYTNEPELAQELTGKPEVWEKNAPVYPMKTVQKAPLLENVITEADIDLFKLPAPQWHEKDGGRYVGTGCVVILRDPDTGLLNLGCYRVMLTGKNTATIYISVGKHGNTIMKKYHEQGLPCPVAVSLGHTPALLVAATLNVPQRMSEYDYAGAILGENIKVVPGIFTDLLLPAYGEIVLEGECLPGEMAPEGPFGEWTGYYGGERKPAPVMHVRNVLHRHNPVALGCSPAGRGDFYEVVYWHALFRSATLKKALEEAGVPGVRGVWPHEFGGARQFLAVSINQQFSGHSRQAAFVASQCREGAYAGRYVVVVDDDIDPTDIKEVLWAMCTRVDPVTDIDFIRKAWSTRLDPMKSTDSVPEADAFYNTRAIIDACIPYERKKNFPLRNAYTPALKSRILDKWKDVITW